MFYYIRSMFVSFRRKLVVLKRCRLTKIATFEKRSSLAVMVIIEYQSFASTFYASKKRVGHLIKT